MPATLTPEQQRLEAGGFFSPVQAAAVNLDGFTHRDDFMPTVGEILRKETVLWQMLPKEPAEADVVRELLEGADPSTGFFSKTAMNPPENATNQGALDISDTGQEVKAIGGVIQVGHYARSLYEQQGSPFTNQLNLRTSKLLTGTAKALEKSLFTGNASVNALSINGLDRLMPVNHAYTADKTADDLVTRKLRAICRLASFDENILRTVTHVFTSGLGCEIIENEVDDKLHYQNLDNIRAGLSVPSLITQAGVTPIIPSPYILDTDGGEGNTDTVHYYLVDMNSLVWKGVFPVGGQRTYDPQIFDTMTVANPYLVEKRIALAYGTLYAKNRGQGIWKLSVTVPSGTVGAI